VYKEVFCPQVCCDDGDDDGTDDDDKNCVDKTLPGFIGKWWSCEEIILFPEICDIPLNDKTFRDYCCKACNGDQECGDVKKFYMKPEKKKNSCKWVGKKSKKRCRKRFKGVHLSDFCGSTCDKCKTEPPTASPTWSPTATLFPTALPTWSPTRTEYPTNLPTPSE